MAYKIDLAVIEETAALGLTRWKELATACGCSTDTLENIHKTDGSAIEEARRRGIARAQETVARALMKRVQAGDTGALNSVWPIPKDRMKMGGRSPRPPCLRWRCLC